jgi:urea carboxylase system permease
MQIVLPSIWSGFQVFQDPTHNAVFLGICVIAITTIVNILGVKVMSKINNIGVAAELLGLAVVIVLLLFHLHRGPGVVLDTTGVGPGLPGWHSLGYLAPLMLAAIVPGYTLFGFDTAGSLAEETTEPRRRTPPAILRAVGAAGLAGAVLLIVSMMAAKSVDITKLSTGGLPLVLEDALGSTVAKVLLFDVAIAIFVCALAIHTASIRIVFSMARDGNLPAAERLAHVTARRKSPAMPAVVNGLVAALILLLNNSNSKLFLVVTSVGIVIVYIAYLLVTAPLLRRRAQGWGHDDAAARDGMFTLGRRKGMAVNIVAVTWGLLMGLNLIWPRSDIYGTGAYAWGGVIVVAVVLAVGFVYYFGFQRHRASNVVAAHRTVALTSPDIALATE